MHPNKFKLAFRLAALGTTFAMLTVAQPAPLAPPQLDQLVSRIALYPDPLLAQVLAASTYWDEIPAAVQRMRHKAKEYGYLQANSYFNVVDDGGYIEILPVAPGLVYVPEYDPLVVFARPARGVVIGGAIRFGPAITITAAFAPWGWVWAQPAFLWRSHTILIDRHPWVRTWVNREHYVHPYAAARIVGPRVEHHELRGRVRR